MDEDNPQNVDSTPFGNRKEIHLRHCSGEKLNVLEKLQKSEPKNSENLPALRNTGQNENNLLVPTQPWSIVLYRGGNGTTVLHNPDRRIVSVKQLPSYLVPYNYTHKDVATPEGFEIIRRPEKCSMCGRPWPRNMPGSRRSGDWINNDYFIYLENLRNENEEILIPGDNNDNRIDPHIDTSKFSTSTVTEGSNSFMDDVIKENNTPAPLIERHDSSVSNNSDKQNNFFEFPQKCFNQGYYNKFFIQLKRLGNGQGPDVYLCNHILDNVSLGYFAVKTIPIGRSHEWLSRVLNEVFMLSRIHHESIIRYHHAWIESTKPSKFVPEVPCLFILMEYANGGNLQEYIDIIPDETDYYNDVLPNLTEQQKKKLGVEKLRAILMSRTAATSDALNPDAKTREELRIKWLGNASNPDGGIMQGLNGKKVRFIPENQIWLMFIEACDGLNYLHKHNILHRDLKPSNILLQFENILHKDFSCPKVIISDLGNCKMVEEERIEERTGYTGTIAFLPPELIKLNHSDSAVDDNSIKSDIWSLGLILYYMCYATVPYSQTKNYAILKKEIKSLKKVVVPSCLPRISLVLNTLIEKMLNVDPNSRPTTDAILAEFNIMHADTTKFGGHTILDT